jgi:hypothetical protein
MSDEQEKHLIWVKTNSPAKINPIKEAMQVRESARYPMAG